MTFPVAKMFPTWPLVFGGVLVVTIAGLAIGLYWSITSHAKTKAALDAARAYIEATDEVRDAQDSVPTDPDDLVRWLKRFSR